MRAFVSSICLLCLLCLASCGAPTGDTSGEAAVRKQSAAFAEAFNRHDAKALADLWAEDAFYVDLEGAETLKGREEIASHYRSIFEREKDATLELQIDKITFPAADQAVEAGAAVVTYRGQDPIRTAFKAYYQKRRGDWVLTQVRELAAAVAPTNYAHLKDLEWLTGEWIDSDEDSEIISIGKWDNYKNFLTQQFTVSVEGQIILEGKQVIAWDPIKQRIRSWMFDSDGGFGEAWWKQEGKSWLAEYVQTLSDGTRASAVNIYTPSDATHYTWESTGREVGGELLPDIGPITVERKKG